MIQFESVCYLMMVTKYDFEWVEKYDRSTAEVCRVEGTYGMYD